MTDPETVQIPVVVDVRATVRDDVAVAAITCAAPPTVMPCGVSKVIDWAVGGVIVKDWTTWDAAW